MNEFNVFNETNEDISFKNDLIGLVNYSLEVLEVDNAIFDIILVDDEEIKKINKQYRNKDTSTDVISFALEDEKTINIPSIRMLGDVYVSFDTAKSQAKEYNHSLKRELSFLIVHGLLHLLGYSHDKIENEKKMFELQERILEGYGIKR